MWWKLQQSVTALEKERDINSFLCNYYRVCYYKSGKKRLWNCCLSRNAVPESDSYIPYILKTEAAARMTADPCFEQERGEAQINTYESRM